MQMFIMLTAKVYNKHNTIPKQQEVLTRYLSLQFNIILPIISLDLALKHNSTIS
jgi:hypothetical protein